MAGRISQNIGDWRTRPINLRKCSPQPGLKPPLSPGCCSGPRNQGSRRVATGRALMARIPSRIKRPFEMRGLAPVARGKAPEDRVSLEQNESKTLSLHLSRGIHFPAVTGHSVSRTPGRVNDFETQAARIYCRSSFESPPSSGGLIHFGRHPRKCSAKLVS